MVTCCACIAALYSPLIRPSPLRSHSPGWAPIKMIPMHESWPLAIRRNYTRNYTTQTWVHVVIWPNPFGKYSSKWVNIFPKILGWKQGGPNCIHQRRFHWPHSGLPPLPTSTSCFHPASKKHELKAQSWSILSPPNHHGRDLTCFSPTALGLATCIDVGIVLHQHLEYWAHHLPNYFCYLNLSYFINNLQITIYLP